MIAVILYLHKLRDHLYHNHKDAYLIRQKGRLGITVDAMNDIDKTWKDMSVIINKLNHSIKIKY